LQPNRIFYWRPSVTGKLHGGDQFARLKDQDFLVFDPANQPIVAHTVFPELPETLALPGLPKRARGVETGNTTGEELQNAPGSWGSSWFSWRSAAGENSAFQAMVLHALVFHA
jgi:hypothetical protein